MSFEVKVIKKLNKILPVLANVRESQSIVDDSDE